MKPRYSLLKDVFVIENYNRARPFSSFLPGIAGEFGKPLWVFYTNRGQCISSFGARNKNGAMLEFYPANKAYQMTPHVGFRTFLKLRSGPSEICHEPFRVNGDSSVRQVLRLRPYEVEIEEFHSQWGIRISVVFFCPPNEALPLLIREVRLENTSRRKISCEIADGLPQVVPFGLSELLWKQMSRTMEAFAEVKHVPDRLPFYKLKVEPSDHPEVQWVEGGFFTFTLLAGKPQDIVVDPETLFGQDTSLEVPQTLYASRRFRRPPQRTETLTPAAFCVAHVTLEPGGIHRLQSFYGQAPSWPLAAAFRQRLVKDKDYVRAKREENARLITELTDLFSIHSDAENLDAYSRQAFLDNTLRGGRPFSAPGQAAAPVFHYYTRKHGDMERDYNFFELSPSFFSQGNGNYRDVNQNRRCEPFLFSGRQGGLANIETFFNLIQLDGFNPLVIHFERFLADSRLWSPGELLESLMQRLEKQKALEQLVKILGTSKKIQEAFHGEGFWVDHWTYNLDLIENYLAIYPEDLPLLMRERRHFTYYDNEHAVQPRAKKYVLRSDGAVRQVQAVVVDREKRTMIRHRQEDPHKVRTRLGEGPIYETSLLVKMLGLIGIKAASLDPAGVGMEMEAGKPGWCDALNGLPGLIGSSVNESYELRRWALFLREHLPQLLRPSETERIPKEIVHLLRGVTEALNRADTDDFFQTWDALATLRENFRENTRLGIDGEEIPFAREEMEKLLAAVDRVLDLGLRKARRADGLVTTYFIHEVTRYERLPLPGGSVDSKTETAETVKALAFKQIPVSPFLEGPVHALRTLENPMDAKKLYQAVKSSELYDRKLKMYKLNVPLKEDSFEIGRNKIFTPGWLENESIFLHMAYKYLLETLRSGLAQEFFEDLRHGLIAFQDPHTYGRSPLENSSFIASSRFPDPKVHGTGFVARLTGATAEWMSMVFFMGLGRRPFKWTDNQLRFEPQPTLAGWLFSSKDTPGFPKGSFGFKLFGKTWILYHNPDRLDTYRRKPLHPVSYLLRYADRREVLHSGSYLPDPLARDLRDGKLERLTIELA